MRSKKMLTLALVVILALVAACSQANDAEKKDEKDNVNESGFPIVDDDITLKVFTGKSEANVDIDWNDLLVWNEYEDMTNIEIDWFEQVGPGSMEEKRNLALGGGSLPDVFFASGLSNNDLFKYGEQGVLIKLNDLIDKYAPNLKTLMEEDPSIKKGLTFPNGDIYSMPYIQDKDSLAMRMGAPLWIYQEWLDRVNMDMPETTDEFYEFLKAVQKTDDDIIPYGGSDIDTLIWWLEGSFGLNNRSATFIDMDPDNNDLRFFPVSPEYREMLEYIGKLYEENLINQNIFSIEYDQYMDNASDGKYASTGTYDPEQTLGVSGFESAPALEGPNGDKMFTSVNPSLVNIGQFTVTSENPNPAATIRWIDYFYSGEGMELMYMGIKDETFVEKDGEVKYIDEIEEAENREEQISKYLPFVATTPPGLIKIDYFFGAESSEASLEAADKMEPYISDEIWPAFTYTKDENKVLNSIGNDIEKYVEEMRDKFISGNEKLDDKGWEKYVENIEKIKLEEYMEVHENAYERYKDN